MSSTSQNTVVKKELVHPEVLVNCVEAPLDLSFRGLSYLEEIAEEMNEVMSDYPENARFITKQIKLNNNMFVKIDGFHSTLSTMLCDLDMIGWIDLSFNDLTGITNSFTQFPNLKMLYLHGNSIKKLEEVNKLSTIETLIKLTLHGNDIESQDNYRSFVLAALPNLKSFDFSDVTPSDRFKMQLYSDFKKRTAPPPKRHRY